MIIQLYGYILSSDGSRATSQDELVIAMREMRDVLLSESDWTQMIDCPLSEEIKNDWRIWRQEMRDITSVVSLPLDNTLKLPTSPTTGRPTSWSNWDLTTCANPWGVETHEHKETAE